MTSKNGVGTELSKLIPKWAVKSGAQCNCRNVAAKMDRYGIKWCEDNRNQIITHLMEQDEHLIPAFKLVPEAMKKIAAERLLNKAIKNARG